MRCSECAFELLFGRQVRGPLRAVIRQRGHQALHGQMRRRLSEEEVEPTAEYVTDILSEEEVEPTAEYVTDIKNYSQEEMCGLAAKENVVSQSASCYTEAGV